MAGGDTETRVPPTKDSRCSECQRPLGTGHEKWCSKYKPPSGT